MLKTDPAVFAVGRDYQIMVPVEAECMMWVKVGDKTYYDESNGVMRSHTLTHRATVPAKELDRAGEYTVCTVEMLERKPYFSKTGKTEEKTYAFRPVPKDRARAYEIGDAHCDVDEPCAAAAAFGDIDFLIMNGDIPNDGGSEENLLTAYQIAERITHGEIPIVFARGNHDVRGVFAENTHRYIPADNGRTFYSFRLGSIWGLILDCGEDKDDDHPEYGGTVCCHVFRQRQTEYIKSIIADAANEYLADGVEHRIVIAHNPFSRGRDNPPFIIEKEIFSEWSSLLRENVHPDVMIAAHVHELEVFEPDDTEGLCPPPCTVVVGTARDNGYYAGTGFEFTPDGITAVSTSDDGRVLMRHTIKS